MSGKAAHLMKTNKGPLFIAKWAYRACTVKVVCGLSGLRPRSERPETKKQSSRLAGLLWPSKPHSASQLSNGMMLACLLVYTRPTEQTYINVYILPSSKKEGRHISRKSNQHTSKRRTGGRLSSFEESLLEIINACVQCYASGWVDQ